MSRAGIATELHKPARKHFERRHVVTKGMNDLLQVDLAEMIPYSKQNKGYKYILIVIDVYSKYAWARPLKNKTGIEVMNNFEYILKQLPTKPKYVQTDHGGEFYNTRFKKMLKTYNIKHYSVYSTMKACVAERFIRTLKTAIFKLFTERGNHKWIELLPTVIRNYNQTVHSTTKMKPIDVKDNSLLSTVYNYSKTRQCKSKFKIGDFVRISRHRNVFSKGYLPQWSTEIFKVHTIQKTVPITYLLKDLKGENIFGAFYSQEIQKTKYPNIYLVENIIKKKADKVFVKWLGFPNSENSWISVTDLL